MDKNIDFIYLSEKDTIKAGVTNMNKCVETMTEVFELLATGDYLMGGINGNSHGIKLHFPKVAEFKNMPLDGPDRRFCAMIGYLGGSFRICGEKWYGSNIANKKKGLPRSILMIMLNDVDTGAPKALISGNIASAMRTGAVPGIGAKFLSKNHSKTIGIIGAGVIGKTSLMALIDVCKEINEIKIFDIFENSATKLSKEVIENFGIRSYAVNSVKEAVTDSDIVNVATSGNTDPVIDDNWLKDGSLLILPGTVSISKSYIINSKLVVDNWRLYESYASELLEKEGTYAQNLSGMCGHLLDYVYDGSLSVDSITNLGDIIIGNKKGRTDDKERIVFVTDGMAIEDIAWGHRIYENALNMGLGISLNLWENPYLY